jgi:hypothetical protein
MPLCLCVKPFPPSRFPSTTMPTTDLSAPLNRNEHAFGFWQNLTEGGPLYILFHILTALGVVVAIFTITRRFPLPWMLFASCMPFIWGSAAAHIGFLGKTIALVSESSTPPAILATRFTYDIVDFNWACIISVLLMVISWFARPRRLRHRDSINH